MAKRAGGLAAPAAVCGVEMKWVALFLLVVQNTALVLLMRSSLTAPGEHYIVTTAVACMEGVKIVTCLLVEGWGFPSLPAYAQHLARELAKPKELAMLAVPSLLYTLQNNLLYIALANLDAAIYQVCYQLKILTTALFSVVILQRALSRSKWASLVILTLGVSLTELDAASGHKARPAKDGDTAQSPMLGFVCVLMACLTSGFAGVWFEKILKGVGSGSSSSGSNKAGASSTASSGPGAATATNDGTGASAAAAAAATSGGTQASTPAGPSLPPPPLPPPPPKSMWIRNIQMGLTSVVLALLAVYSKDRAVVAEKGFFYGYNASVVGVILLQALGGLVVAAVVKYADNILKGFGSSISIVISCALEWLFFDFQPTLRFLVGAGLVNAALFVYQDDRLFAAAAGALGGSGKGEAGGEDGLPLLPLHHHRHKDHRHKDSSDESSASAAGPAALALAPATKVYEGLGTLTARSSISAAATSPTSSPLLGGGGWRDQNSKSRDLKSLV